MRVRDLPLADDLVAHYESAGIVELYPPQAAAVDAGVTRGENVVVAVPTASGKTFIAELAMLTSEGPALYIVPLRALAREKYETFSELPGVEVGISTGDLDSAEELGSYDIVVATAEKVDSAIRSGASWVDDLACVVVDEVHLLGSKGRGPTLEVTIATLGRRAPDVQVVALSATVDNPDEIADWLGAELVRSRWRPVDLRTGVYAEGRVDFDDGSTLAVAVDEDEENADTAATVELVRGAIDDGGQCLAFVRSRREAEALATRLSGEGIGTTDALAEEIREAGQADTGRRLAECVEGGVAFHHAGLRAEHRALVENAFRGRELKCICATPTLAAGVNVPARRVVIRDQKRYTGSGMEWLPVLEVHQMCGRAGRPHLDPYGEAVLVAGDEAGREELRERYVGAEPEAVESQLADREALRTHVLAIVASGFADSQRGVLDLLDATFYAHDRPEESLAGLVESVVADLVEWEMLTAETGENEASEGETEGGTNDGEAEGGNESGGTLAATALGEAVSRQYIAPQTGARIVGGIETMRGMESVTGLTALEVVCDTPDMHGTYLGNRERATMYQYARRHAAELTTDMGATDRFERWLESVKTARILLEWAEGASTEELVDEYRIGPGDLESRVERAQWLLGAAAAVADVVGGDGTAFREVRERLVPDLSDE
ncbi:DEAD/DEAH box helicase [Salinigranum rubrum]|uniref:ATP-dependent DNA helicase Hel308 n=1 Tax=Salinigranum rubrum TaxID=755307 RepID=A0A2I8VHD9_9EURY|nr:DEAD/DEAH box helicase [Salinigranum rubrum]AUV81304.1 DEAD/DEAH box helicase [Salinigranum rubrum]